MSNHPMIPHADRLQLKPRDAAEMLSISERTLRKLAQHGEIPRIGRGRLTRFSVDDLRAWQRKNRGVE